jgi:prepilin-type N-terminal cleavage/methylation domain-containing protein
MSLATCSTIAGLRERVFEVMAMNQKHRGWIRGDAGFTLLEIMVVVGLLGVLAAMALMVSPVMLSSARADAGLSQVLDALRSAREVAISQRRNVQLDFIGTNAIQTRRVDIGANGQILGTTVLRTIELENRMEFRLDPDVADDTPDQFGNGTALDFDSPPPRMFTSEGTFVNATGDVINGTVFLSIRDQENSARAITIMGATALISVWRWNGRQWVE